MVSLFCDYELGLTGPGEHRSAYCPPRSLDPWDAENRINEMLDWDNLGINEDDKRIKQITNIPVPSQRQETQVPYTLNGAIYLSSTSSLMAKKTFLTESTIGYIMPVERSVDIDTQLDWEWGEFLFKRNLKIFPPN